MRIIKNIIKVASLSMVVILLAMALAWLLVDDVTLISALNRPLQSATDTHVRYHGDVNITRTLTPVLSVEQLLIEDRSGRYRLELRSLQLALSLPKLLLGVLDISLLRLSDARITLMQGASAGPEKTTMHRHVSMPFKPLLHDAQIDRLSIVREDGALDLALLDINAVAVKLTPDTAALTLAGEIELAGEKLAIEATLPDIYKAVDQHTLDFSVVAQWLSFELDSNGQIALDKPDLTVDAGLRVRASDLSKLPISPETVVIPGTLMATAQLNGSIDQLVLNNISTHWQGSGLSKISLNGEIGNLFQLDTIQLHLLGKLDQLAWLTPLLPDNMASLDSAHLSAQISGNYKQLGIHTFSLEAKTADKLDLSLQGQFDVVAASNGSQLENLDLKFAFAAPTTHAARALLFAQVPELGAISGKLDIRSTTGAARLENIVIKSRHRKGTEVRLSGNIAHFPLDFDQINRGYALDVVMKVENASSMTKTLGLDVPLNGAVNLAYRIEGDSDALALKQINLRIEDEAKLQVSAQGEVLFGDWKRVDPLQTINLKVQANAHNSAAFSQLFGQSLPELGGLIAVARLHTVDGKHRLDRVNIKSHTGAPLQLSLTGSVSNVTLFPQATMRGMQLNAEVATTDTAQLNAMFGRKDWLPAIGPLEASAVITGSDRQLRVEDVVLVAGQENILLVNAYGRLGRLSAVNDWHPQDTDFNIKVSSTSSSDAAKSLGYQIPELGSLTAEARIQDKNKRLALESAIIHVGDAAAPFVDVTGFIDDIFGEAKTRWEVSLNMDGHTLAEFSDQVPLPDLGSLLGRMVIANSDGSLGVDFLQIESSQNDLLGLTINGHFDDFTNPETLTLDVDLRAKDLQLIGSLVDQKWPAVGPIQMKSAIRQVGEKTEFDATLSADGMHFNAAIGGVLDASPLYISGKISAQQFFFPPLFEGIVDRATQKKPVKSQLFPHLPIDLGWLKKANLDLEIDIESFSKAKSSIESAQFVIAQKDGHLSINPAVLVYPKGRLEMDFQLDSQDPPQVSFNAYGQDLNPWQTLDIQLDRKTFNTDVDIDVAVTTFGVSPHKLVVNANGDIYMTMKNGKIRRALLDLVLVDVIGWTIGKTTHQTFYDIDCGVADYTINQGVISTNAFLLDSKSITISGEGSVDLGRETVDYVMLPRKKTMMVGAADPVKISGTLNSPSVSVIPWKSAAKTYGGMVFAPYIFVGISVVDYLKGMMGIDFKSSPCLNYKKQYKSRHKVVEH